MIYKCIFLIVVLLTLSTCAQITDDNIGQFWHVTDFHVDDRYSENGDPDFMCWDVGTTPTRNPGPYGDYLCDSPEILFKSAIDAMIQFNSNPDFILWTGDDTTHVNDSFFSEDIVFTVIQNITSELKSAFPNSLVLPVLGNHDLYPQNQIGPGESTFQSRVADLWTDWLDDYDAYDSFKSSGSYVADIPNSNVTVIALNTLLWYESNKITKNDKNMTDPSGIFSELETQLTLLANDGRKVYIMGHIPPGLFERYFDKQEGFHWYQPRYNERYIELMQTYGHNVEAQFFGHHHSDSMRIFKTIDNEPISYGLIAPGVTPMKSTLSETAGANNPGIRLVTYDRESGEVLEVTTYYLNLRKANEIGKITWEFEYNLTEILDIDVINAISLNEAALKLETNRTYFENYYSTNTVQWEANEVEGGVSTCNDTCRKVQFCSITEVDYNKYYECNTAKYFFMNYKMVFAMPSLLFAFYILL